MDASHSHTLVVCAGNSSWLGRSVQLEVQNMCSWMRVSSSNLKRRVREMLLNFFIFFVSSFKLAIHATSQVIKILKPIPIGSFGSDHCQRAASLLVCQSYFPLCNCESGRSYWASREECERISMVECEEEWTSARQYGIPLPNCTDLPQEVTSESDKNR